MRRSACACWQWHKSLDVQGVVPPQPNAELTGRRRQATRPGLAKMYRVPPDWAWWLAVGAPVERLVRRHCDVLVRYC
jgi:hypothetical protein